MKPKAPREDEPQPCDCQASPIYTGMSPIGGGWSMVSFHCGICDATWNMRMTNVDANLVRAEDVKRQKNGNGHGG